MRILFLDGTAGYSPTRLQEKPTGGILTSLTFIPRYLAKQGHEVFILSNHTKEETVEGVRHVVRPLDGFHADVVVFNRNMLDMSMVRHWQYAHKVWWLHDIVDHRYLEDEAFRHMDTVVALSDYCKRSYADYYDIPADKFVAIENGVDRSIFYPGTGKRDRNLYVVASAPIKGNYPLEFAFHNMTRLHPEFRLAVYSSQKLHDLVNTPGMEAGLKALSDCGIEVMDPIPQSELADVFRKAWALLMPGHYPENCSNIVLQARACGLPVIGSPVGSLPEQIPAHAGLLTKTGPSDFYWWWKDFAVQCADMYAQDGLHEALSRSAPQGVRSWEDIGAEWNRMLNRRVNVNADLRQIPARV